jgi:nitrate ABC transporter ATP-binding subunit
MHEALLSIQGVSKTFGSGSASYTAVKDVDLSVTRGEVVSIIGHSGCGKSTLLGMISGLVSTTTGTLTLNGQPIKGPGPERGLVFQHHALLPWLSIYDNVYVAVDAAFKWEHKAEKVARVERALRSVELWSHKHKKPHQISGGMKQRTAVVRAFVLEPQVLLLDEPFVALDALTKATLHDELLQLWATDSETKTIILVTHDIDEAIFLSDRVVVMTNGPEATIGEIVTIRIPRPRDKRAMLHSPEYAQVKDYLLHRLTLAVQPQFRVQPEESHHADDGRLVMYPSLPV